MHQLKLYPHSVATRWHLILNPGEGEVEASQALLARGFMPVRQYPLGPYYLDLAIPDRKLAIEIDGGDKLKNYHQRVRQEYINSRGWVVLRCHKSAAKLIPELVETLLEELKQDKEKETP